MCLLRDWLSCTPMGSAPMQPMDGALQKQLALSRGIIKQHLNQLSGLPTIHNCNKVEKQYSNLSSNDTLAVSVKCCLRPSKSRLQISLYKQSNVVAILSHCIFPPWSRNSYESPLKALSVWNILPAWYNFHMYSVVHGQGENASSRSFKHWTGFSVELNSKHMSFRAQLDITDSE